jgi:hypothetical protein
MGQAVEISQGATAQLRAEMAPNASLSGLWKNKKVFFISLFASYGSEILD